MIKRLTISLLLMGLAVFSLGAAAFAWFQTSETGDVAIESGSVDIAIDIDEDCDGDFVEDEDIEGTVDGDPYLFEWDGIVPGDSTRDCFRVRNTGDDDLDIFVKHSDFGGLLVDHLEFTYDLNANPTNVLCGPNTADTAPFTTANGQKGCEIGNVSEGGSLTFEVRVEFPYENSDQSGLENKQLNMTSTLTGYSTP